MENDELDMKNPELRHFILQIALKCADISNPCRPWDVSRKWSLKVCDEFFRQGDYERQLGLPVTDICDRYNNTVPKIQTGTRMVNCNDWALAVPVDFKRFIRHRESFACSRRRYGLDPPTTFANDCCVRLNGG